MKYLKLFEEINTLEFSVNYNKFINYKIGDEVELVGEVDGKILDGQIGKILNLNHHKNNCYDIRSPYFDGKLNNWSGITPFVSLQDGENWYITPYNVKREDVRSKTKNLKEDPFEEEFWGYEED